MTDSQIRKPGALSSGCVALAVAVLPAPSRDRYSDEFRADLSTLDHGRLRHAVGVLIGAGSLRRAIRENTPDEAARSVTYWKCRLHLHHYAVVNDDNPEFRASTHKECTRCLKFKEIADYEPTSGAYMAGPLSTGRPNRG
jgi:hypothetical protein